MTILRFMPESRKAAECVSHSVHKNFPCLIPAGAGHGDLCVSTPGSRVHHQHFNHSFAGRGAVSLIPSTAQRRRWFETVTFGEDAL